MPFYSRGDSAENASAAGAQIATAHSVNGMPWSGNNYLLDGVANNEPQNAYINITPPLEAIQEFKVQTNNPTAEFGVFGGAAVNLTIRSGTNDFHGSAFDYIRDDALFAKSYFALSKAPYNSNQPGATFGGPLVKSRASFFGDYQALVLDAGRTQVLTVPTALMRQGNFTEISQAIYDALPDGSIKDWFGKDGKGAYVAAKLTFPELDRLEEEDAAKANRMGVQVSDGQFSIVAVKEHERPPLGASKPWSSGL